MRKKRVWLFLSATLQIRCWSKCEDQSTVADELDHFYLLIDVLALIGECKDQGTDPHETWNDFVYALFRRQFQDQLLKPRKNVTLNRKTVREKIVWLISDRMSTTDFLSASSLKSRQINRIVNLCNKSISK